MRNICILLFLALAPLRLLAAIDMQAHVACDEGKQAYSAYLQEQNQYYTGTYAYSTLLTLSGDELFGRLNQLMGNTCKLDAWNLDYGTLRYEYVNVDRDLNRSGYIIGYYDGKQLDGDWGSGWNREHTWPQSKGAKKETTMGHDMQSVRPTNESVNSSRGNTAYGEAGSYYDPDDEISINNSAYKKINLGTYRGDAARVILYDYLVYGQAGGYKNGLYNGNAQLLSKLGTSGVFESIRVLLKWHMQDPPSLTEMVRNDGAQEYQGNRNPMIDFPELAIEVFANYNQITRYNVTYHVSEQVSPRYMHTLSDGFITYLTAADGSHPASVEVKGAKAEYNASLGRLIITNVTGNVTIGTATSLEDVEVEMPYEIYNISGTLLSTTDDPSSVLSSFGTGMYIIRHGQSARKISIR